MRAALLYYDGFVEFEAALTLLLLKDLDWHFTGLETRSYKSMEGQVFLTTHAFADLQPETLDLLLIPGGDSTGLMAHSGLKAAIEACLAHGGIVAGICGGAELLAGLGLLKGCRCTGGTSGMTQADPLFDLFRETLLVTKEVVVAVSPAPTLCRGTLVTAQGQAYAELAVELQQLMEKRSAEQSGKPYDPQTSNVTKAETLKWLKNIRF